MSIYLEIILLCILVVIVYYAKKYFDFEELKPIIAEVVKIIINVEKTQNTNINGIVKKEIVENIISKQLPKNDIKKINKSIFKNIGNFVQYVFINFAEPILLKKLNKSKQG